MTFTSVKRIAMALLCASAMPVINAQEEKLPSIEVSMDTRADFTYDYLENADNTSGIHGRYLNLAVKGNILPNLSYNWRQRMNKFSETTNDVFAATDWIYLTYKPTENFAISGGKQVVLIGGYEYDAAPIDIFFASRFWNNIACYQFGVSAAYITNNGKHSFTFQICNSPYQGMSSNCYAYNLYWSGDMGFFKTLWSVNMIEVTPGFYANFISLGNRLELDKFNFELDLMNRATDRHKYFFSDYSVIAKAEYDVLPWMTVMAKGGYDDFRAMPGAPEHLDNPFYGGGLEFFPMHGSRNLRIHALGYLYHENDGQRVTQINVGVKWKVNLFTRK